MTRSEILQIAKPIFFTADMVKLIPDGRKTATRRAIKLKYDNTHHEMFTNKYGTRLIEIQDDIEGEAYGKNPDGTTWHKLRGYIEPKPPYKKGDYLYVREAGKILSMKTVGRKVKMLFPADDKVIEFSVSEPEYGRLLKYKLRNNLLPPYWLTKEESRIFLRVTDVRVERLQEITVNQMIEEGVIPFIHPDGSLHEEAIKTSFIGTWNSTLPKKDLDRYGWDTNPWVWVIEFERVEVEL